jgi:hypothetical protein
MTWLVFRGTSTGKAPSAAFSAICLLEKVEPLHEQDSPFPTLRRCGPLTLRNLESLVGLLPQVHCRPDSFRAHRTHAHRTSKRSAVFVDQPQQRADDPR